MVCCIHDPNLASLLAGKEEAMPAPGDGLLVGCFLAIEILLLLSIGVLPW